MKRVEEKGTGCEGVRTLRPESQTGKSSATATGSWRVNRLKKPTRLGGKGLTTTVKQIPVGNYVRLVRKTLDKACSRKASRFVSLQKTPLGHPRASEEGHSADETLAEKIPHR